jgi:restriction endonuclease S subunit
MRPSTGTSLRKSTAGASLPRIPKDALADLDIPMPPIDRQRAIGGVASCVRRHRELTSQLVTAEATLAETSLERVFAQLN